MYDQDCEGVLTARHLLSLHAWVHCFQWYVCCVPCLLCPVTYCPEQMAARADDDTWVNMPLAQSLLAQYNETHPFALGLVRRTAYPPKEPDALAWIGGGSGIFMSQVSLLQVTCMH